MYFLYCVINTVFVELILYCSVTLESFNRQPFGTLKGIPDVVVPLDKLPVQLLDVQRNVVFCETRVREQFTNSVCSIPNSILFSVDKKNQLDVTFCILYFSSNSCPTCFGQPCAHHQELTTA